MKNRRERFIILPFAIGCNSPSSVAVEAGGGGGRGGSSSSSSGKGGGTTTPSTSQSKKVRTESSRPTHESRRQKGGNGSSGEERTKSSHGFLAVPKASISSGVDKLIKSLKSFSQLFDMILYKEEIEEMEMEMEIGLPTDVKHVTHIGLDGTTTTNPVNGWENLKPPEIITFPSISLRQFELTMAAQADSGNNGNKNHLHPSKFNSRNW